MQKRFDDFKDNNAVHKTGDENIDGLKTFSKDVTAPHFIGDGSQLTNLPQRPLYTTTGTNTDGSITQKAITDAINIKAEKAAVIYPDNSIAAFSSASDAAAALTENGSLYINGLSSRFTVATSKANVYGFGSYLNTNELQVGVYPASTTAQEQVILLGFNSSGRIVNITQNSSDKPNHIIFKDVTITEGGYFEMFGIFTDAQNQVDIIEFIRIKATKTEVASGVVSPAIIVFQSRTDGLDRNYQVIVRDCDLSSTVGPIFGGYVNRSGTRIHLQGNTILSPAANHAVDELQSVEGGAFVVIPTGEVIVDERTAQGGGLLYTPENIKEAVLSGAFTNGEFQGTQPSGSLKGMCFTKRDYKFEYTFAINDNDGSRLAWVRTVKG